MAELLPLDPDQLLTTTRAVRKRLDLTRPVERSVVEECIAIAMQAPSGSNRQTWQWVLVDDPATKDIQVIFLTAVVQKAQVRAKGGVVGGRNFIAKPVEAGEVVKAIEKCLGMTPAPQD